MGKRHVLDQQLADDGFRVGFDGVAPLLGVLAFFQLGSCASMYCAAAREKVMAASWEATRALRLARPSAMGSMPCESFARASLAASFAIASGTSG